MTRRGDRDADTSKELYRMRGSRFVYANEFSRNSVLNETFLKAITDGGKISCRQLYNAAIEYTPTYKLWFSTNHLPNLQAMDEGIRRRLVVIPFRLALAPEAVNKNLAETLRQEADHILLWLLYGYWKYTQEGLEPPEAVRQASAAYFGEQDVYQTFLQERYEADVNGKVYAKELYQDYRWWCGDNGERGVSNIVFGKELQRLGLQKDKDRYGIFYSLKKKSLDA
jgi:putative DNA primase/helicase